MYVPVSAAADAGDATQNPKTDEGDSLTGFWTGIFKSLLPAHASPSRHQLCSGPCSYYHFALYPCQLLRDSEEINFNLYMVLGVSVSLPSPGSKAAMSLFERRMTLVSGF